MKHRSTDVRSARALVAIAALVAPALGCEEQCPHGGTPITWRSVVCDELTDRCEERVYTGCPCPPADDMACSCPSGVCLEGGASSSCEVTSGAGPWASQLGLAENEHVIDGAFTGDEWEGVAPLQGLFTDVYVEYRAGRLYFLNDWRANDEGIRPECFNYFRLGLGDDQFELRVFGNGAVEVSRNGAEVSHDADGAYGFGPSPTVATPHTIYEFSIALPPGQIDVCCFDPVTIASCDVLAHEPMVVSVRATASGSEVRRSVPAGSVTRLVRGAACGEGQGICEDGLRCEPVGSARECVVMATSPSDAGPPDAGVPGFDSGPPG